VNNIEQQNSPMNRKDLLLNPDQFHARAQACLLGLAAGDALGDAGRSDAYRSRYGIVNNLFEGLNNTDDTEFAALTARALIDAGGKLTLESVTQAWLVHVLGQGGIQERAGRPLIGAAENLRRGLTPPLSGRDNVMNVDDGAAMRAAPIGIVYAGLPAQAAKQAEIDALVSHADDGVWAAQAVAASISVAMLGASVEDIFDIGMQQIPRDSWLGRAMQHSYDICRSSQCIEDAWQALHDDFWTPAHSASPEAIPQVYGVFYLTGGDFKRGLLWSANFGRDADTIAAVVCALNGARHGLQVIPPDWIDRLRKPSGVCLRFAAQEDLLDLASQLVEIALQLELRS
jgi:ADP-ribosylglycohydrolase